MKLAQFARWCILNGPFEGSDLDGGDVQDQAVKAGLLVEEKYDPNVHGPNEFDVAPGEDFYVLSDEFKTAISAEKD